jgi:hypothetical protein
MGVFVVCWSPFFVTTLLSAFCQSCIHDPELVGTIVNWLGWINSAMNPVIYACWSRDFRRFVQLIIEKNEVPYSFKNVTQSFYENTVRMESSASC